MSLLVFNKFLNNLAPDYLKKLISLRETTRVSIRMDNDYCFLKVPQGPRFARTKASFLYIHTLGLEHEMIYHIV